MNTERRIMIISALRLRNQSDIVTTILHREAAIRKLLTLYREQ